MIGLLSNALFSSLQHYDSLMRLKLDTSVSAERLSQINVAPTLPSPCPVFFLDQGKNLPPPQSTCMLNISTNTLARYHAGGLYFDPRPQLQYPTVTWSP